MGAQEFQVSGRGKTSNEVYRSLYDEAEEEHGHEDGYSGYINSTHGFQEVTSRFKSSGKKIQDYIDIRLEHMAKDNCECICVEEPKSNTNKVKSKVEHIVEKGTKKWVLRFFVYDRDDEVGSALTKGAAVNLARAYTEKTTRRTTIHMRKVLEKGNTLVASIDYKHSTTEKLGKWVFFGLARN